MANETKSSPTDHYFEPNGSNANAENIGHVLNDLTDIVASGTPEEGVDAVKWDGENFILGPAGGGKIEADSHQALMGDGEGGAIGASSGINGNPKFYFYNNSFGYQTIPSNGSPDRQVLTSNPQGLEDLPQNQLILDGTADVSFGEQAVVGISGRGVRFTMHDSAKLDITAGVNRPEDGPEVYIHGNTLIATDDEWYNTGTGKYVPVYINGGIVSQTFNIEKSTETAWSQIYDEMKNTISSFMENDASDFYDSHTKINTCWLCSYSPLFDMLFKNSGINIPSKNLTQYFNVDSEKAIKCFVYSYSQSTTLTGRKLTTTIYIYNTGASGEYYTAKENILLPAGWRLKDTNSHGSRPVITVHGAPSINIQDDAHFEMNSTAQLILNQNAAMMLNCGYIGLNGASTGDYKPDIIMDCGHIHFNQGNQRITEAIPSLLMDCGNIELHSPKTVALTEDNMPSLIMNGGHILVNDEQGQVPEVVFSGGCDVHIAGSGSANGYDYTKLHLFGGLIETSAEWSSQDSWDGAYPGSNSEYHPTVQLQGCPKLHISGSSTVLMHQGAEIRMSGLSQIDMDQYGYVNLTGQSKFIMQGGMGETSPAIQMTPEQMRFGRFGAGKLGSTIDTDYLYKIYAKPFETIDKMEEILSKNEITEEEYNYLNNKLSSAIISKYNFTQTIPMLDSKIVSIVRFTTEEALEQFQGWLTKYYSTSTQYYKTGYFKPTYIAKDTSIDTIVEQSGDSNFCFLANNIPSSISALGDDFIKQNYDLVYSVSDASYMTKYYKKSSDYGTSNPYQNYYQYCSKDLKMSDNPQVQTNYDNNTIFTNRYMTSDSTGSLLKKIVLDYYDSQNYLIKTSTGIPYAYTNTAPASYIYRGTSLSKLYYKNDNTYTRLFSTSFNSVIDNYYNDYAKAPFVSIANNSHVIIENMDDSATFVKIGGSGKGRIESYVGSKDCDIFTQITGKTHVELHDDACIIMRGNTNVSPWEDGATEGHMGRNWTRPVLPNNNGPMCAMYDNSMVFMSREWENKTPKGKYTITGVGLYPDIEKIDNNATVKFSVIKPIVLDWAEDKYEILNNDDDIITVGVDSGSTEEDRRLSNCVGIKFIPIGWKDSPDRQAGAPYFRMIGDVEISARNGDFTFAYHDKSVTFSIDELERLKELLNN